MCREYRTIARTDDAMIAVIRERGVGYGSSRSFRSFRSFRRFLHGPVAMRFQYTLVVLLCMYIESDVELSNEPMKHHNRFNI